MTEQDAEQARFLALERGKKKVQDIYCANQLARHLPKWDEETEDSMRNDRGTQTRDQFLLVSICTRKEGRAKAL